MILNLSALFAGLSVLISPHLVIVGAILAMVLGYRFSLENDHAFDGENLERTVRNAAENVKASVNDFARGFQNGMEQEKSADKTEASEAERSYYTANRPEPTYRPSYPTMNVPVQVESQDGSVSVESDKDGFTNATIE